MACAQAEPHPPKQPRCLICREFLHLKGGWGKVISLFFRFQSFFPAFYHAFLNPFPLSLFFPFSSFPRVVWKMADFSTPHQFWTEHHSFHRAPPLFTEELSDSWGRNRVSAPHESLWESTPPRVIHLNSLNCQKSNILNLKSIPAWPSFTLSLSALKVFSHFKHTLSFLSSQFALFISLLKAFSPTLILPLNRLCWNAGKPPDYNASL